MKFNATVKKPSYVHTNWSDRKQIAGNFKTIRFDKQADGLFRAYNLTAEQVEDLKDLNWVTVEVLGIDVPDTLTEVLADPTLPNANEEDTDLTSEAPKNNHKAVDTSNDPMDAEIEALEPSMAKNRGRPKRVAN